VIKYTPLLEGGFRRRHKRPVGISWRMDETYIKVKGKWVYLYRAVDKESGANKAGIDTINLRLALLFIMGGVFLQINVRQVKYLNNIVEQHHRLIKKITKQMKGFKAFHSADATLSGIELHHMLKKGQHTQSDNQTIFEQFYGLVA
jgi:putative transposase